MRYATYGDGEIETAGERLAAPTGADEAVDWQNLVGALGDDVTNANKVLVLADEEGIPSLREALESALQGEPARVVKALNWTLEVLPTSSSKGRGLETLLSELGINPYRVLACGDGENDVEMMRMVGLPIAMGNAVPLLKRKCAPSTSNAGVSSCNPQPHPNLATKHQHQHQHHP
jgi:hypothetical protein